MAGVGRIVSLSRIPNKPHTLWAVPVNLAPSLVHAPAQTAGAAIDIWQNPTPEFRRICAGISTTANVILFLLNDFLLQKHFTTEPAFFCTPDFYPVYRIFKTHAGIPAHMRRDIDH